MATSRLAPLAAAAVLMMGAVVPQATAEATTSSVFMLLAQLQEQQQLRRQAARSGTLSLLQRSEPANGQGSERTFHALDSNSDGLLSRDEIASFASSQGLDAASAKSELALLDTDGDSALSLSEFSSVLSSTDATSASDASDALPVPAAAPAPAPAVPTVQRASAAQAAPAMPATPAVVPAAVVRVEDLAAQAVAQSVSSPTSLADVASGSDFVSIRAKQLLASWNKFESDAKHAEEEAAALRAKAREELREANELTAIADMALARAKQAASAHSAGEEAAVAGDQAAAAA